VTGVDLDALTERQVAGEQRGIELGGQLLGAVLAEQVGAADVEVEQGVAGEQGEGLIALLAVAQQQRDVLRRVAGRVDDFQADLTELQHLAVGSLAQLETVVRRAATDDLCAAAFGQRLGAGDEVGMDMGFDGVGDAQALLSGQVEVDIDVAPRVDHCGDRGLAVAHQVGNLRQAVSIDRLEDQHGCTSVTAEWLRMWNVDGWPTFTRRSFANQ